MSKKYKLRVPRGTGGKTLPPLPLAGQIELLARVRIKGESPATPIVHEICDKFCLPHRAGNCISGYHTGIERLLAKGNAEAVRLAQEWDLPIKEVTDGDGHLADDAEPDDGGDDGGYDGGYDGDQAVGFGDLDDADGTAQEMTSAT